MSSSDDPRSPEAYAEKPDERTAAAAFVDGDFADAETGFRKLAEQQPGRLDLIARLAHLDLLANRLSPAIERLTRALEGGLRTQTILTHLAEAYLRRGDLGRAALTYQNLGRDGLAGTLAAMAHLQPWRLSAPAGHSALHWLRGEPLPVVAVRINGETANLVIDTGAGDLTLDTHFALQAEVRLGGPEWRTFAGGRPAEVLHGHVEQLMLASQEILDVPVQILDLQSTFRQWFPDLPIHGILGLRVLMSFHCTFDYADRCLRLAPPRTHPSTALGIPFWLGGDAMLLSHADFPRRTRRLVFIDSGMTGGAFAVSHAQADLLGVELHKDKALTGSGGGGEIAGRRAHAKWIRLDGLSVSDVAGLALPELSIETGLGYRIHGLIGHDLLRGTRLALDFTHMRLSLTRSDHQPLRNAT